MLSDLPKRTLATTVSIACILALIFFAFHVWFQYIVASFVALLTAVAVWEYEQFAKAKGASAMMPLLILFSVVQVLSFFVSAHLPHLSWLPFAVFFSAFFLFFALHFHQTEGALFDLATSSFTLLYIAVPMGMILGILYSAKGQDGRLWIAYLLAVTKITDIGAYFGGNLLGRRKLAPHISPEKTLAGAIIGLLSATIASFAFHLLSASVGVGHFHLGIAESLFLGLILGLIGQFGDLAESLLKRDANKKDSNAIPGLGGALDLIDSLLFNVPILYFYLYLKVL